MPSRVIVFGYAEAALASLETFAAMGIAPLAVVVPGNRHGETVETVASDAARRGYPVLVQPPRSRIEPFLAQVRQLRPDFLFVWSYSMLLPPELLATASHGGVNLHAGSLPDYRGGHVLNWALINGERETAVTLHVIDAGIDTGPVFAERRVAIAPEDDILSLHRKLIGAGASLLLEWWPRIESGAAKAIPQDESRARYYRMRTPDDGRISWFKSATEIQNMVRALVAPWPGAFTISQGTRVVIRRAEVIHAPATGQPGTVIAADEGDVQISTAEGVLRATAIEIDGQPATSDVLHRCGLRAGSRLSQ